MAEHVDPFQVLSQPPLHTILADMREQHQRFAATAEKLQRLDRRTRPPGDGRW